MFVKISICRFEWGNQWTEWIYTEMRVFNSSFRRSLNKSPSKGPALIDNNGMPAIFWFSSSRIPGICISIHEDYAKNLFWKWSQKNHGEIALPSCVSSKIAIILQKTAKVQIFTIINSFLLLSIQFVLLLISSRYSSLIVHQIDKRKNESNKARRHNWNPRRECQNCKNQYFRSFPLFYSPFIQYLF